VRPSPRRLSSLALPMPRDVYAAFFCNRTRPSLTRTVVPLLRAHCFVSRPLVEKINPRSVSRGSYFAGRRMHREDGGEERERERERERELKAARKRARSFQITSFPGSRAASTLPAENVKNPNAQRGRGRKEGRRERRGVAVLKLLKPVYRVRGNACYECYRNIPSHCARRMRAPTSGDRAVPLGSSLRAIPPPLPPFQATSRSLRRLCPQGGKDRARRSKRPRTLRRCVVISRTQRRQRRRFGEWTRAEDRRVLLLVPRARAATSKFGNCFPDCTGSFPGPRPLAPFRLTREPVRIKARGREMLVFPDDPRRSSSRLVIVRSTRTPGCASLIGFKYLISDGRSPHRWL